MSSKSQIQRLSTLALRQRKAHLLRSLKLPPRRVEVQRIIPMGQNGWTYKLQTWLLAQPGITNDLGNVTYDEPPPLPALEQLRQHLGL